MGNYKITKADSAVIDFALSEARRYERLANTFANHPAHQTDERRAEWVGKYRQRAYAMYDFATSIQYSEHKTYAKAQARKREV